MADYPQNLAPPSNILPPRVQPVAPPPTPRKAALMERVARLRRQVVLSSIVAFAVVLGFVSGAWQSVGGWVAQQFVTTTTAQQSDDGNNFFNQGDNNSGGSNVGSSGGGAPVSGSGGS
ncbi:MAG: hypothetical protein H0X24_06715 [Ktedonobacterales bacterium]|nr:hypothetical protein [Ktedonobacterales bacterium]